MKFDKVVCTGGSGRLGRYVVDLLKGDCDLTVVDVKEPEASVAFQEVDVVDYGRLKQAFAGQQAVVHLAAIPNPRTAPAEVTFRIDPGAFCKPPKTPA